MSGTTTLGLPYPELTDDPNVPADMQALAEAVDANFTAPATPATVWTTSLGTAADVGPISTSAYTSVGTVTVDTTGAQTLLVNVQVKIVNGSGANKPSVAFRVQDLTAGTATVWNTLAHQLGLAAGGSDAASLGYSFFYTTPSGGSRSLRLGAASDATSVTVKAAGGGAGFISEAAIPPLISATVIK